MTKEITTITTEGVSFGPKPTPGRRLKFWPRWGLGGFYKGPILRRRYFYWTCNEGEFPNFCIKWEGAELRRALFVYIALAPGLRFSWYRRFGATLSVAGQ